MVNSNDLIRDFVNTLHKDPRGDEEELGDPAALTGWLRERGLLAAGAAARPGELRRAVELREALRVLLRANNDVDVDMGPAFSVLDDAARRGRVMLRFAGGAPSLEPEAAGVAGALGRIAAAVHVAVADGSWHRLKACRADDCEWAFVDTARNQSRAWCSMRSCGNREKARAFRRRHTGQTAPARRA
jgi:predicted RNA-binding Zn ribbon-like protein